MKTIPYVLAAAALFAGCNEREPATSEPKIVGGKETGPHPFMAGLIDEGGASSYCGASFIAPDVVLTAAHCVKGAASRMRVSAGLHLNSAHGRVQTIAVDAVRVHPGFGPDAAMQNDVALLFLAPYDAASLPAAIEPIALNTDPSLPAGFGTVIGWGNTSSFGDLFEDGLREVDVPVIAQSVCATAYPGITPKQICAGDFARGGVDSCQGDSGGPLVARNAAGKLVLAGVVSFGEGCALAKQPGVYSRVASFKPWIDGEIQRFRAAATASSLSAADAGDTAVARCYAKLQSVSLAKEGANDLRLTTTYAPSGAFTLMQTQLTPSPKMAPCLLPGASVSLAASAAPFLLVKRGTQSFGAPASASVKANFFCASSGGDGGSGGDGTFNVVIDPSGEASFVRLDGQFMELGAPFTGATSGASLVRVCKVRDASAWLLKVGATFVAEVTSPALGGTRRLIADKEGGDGRRLALSFKAASPTAGVMTLENTLAFDIFTWDLACNVAMTLTGADGRAVAVSERGDGFHYKFVTKESAFGTVRAHQKVAFKYTAAATIARGRAPVCSINERSVAVSVQ